VSAVGPAADSLLARGVSRLRLRAQLAVWRVRHRIRTLELRGDRIVAANSGDRTVRRLLSGNEDNVYQIVQDIGRERMRNAAGRRERRVGSAGGGPHSIGPGDDPHELGAGLAARGTTHTPTRPSEPATAAGTFPLQIGSGRPVYASQGVGPVASPAVQRNIFIRGLGPRGSYPEIAERLTAMGLNGPGVANAVAETLRTGVGPIYIKRLIALLFGREAMQSEGAAATGLLTLGAMRGGAAPGQIFGTENAPVTGTFHGASDLDPVIGREGERMGGGQAPFTPRGAANDQRQAQAGQAAGVSARDPDFGERARAEVLRTIELVYQAVRLMEFKDMTGLRREILTLFEMMDRAHGVNP
jgi:hypothetical protein